jgi:riboflavin synthase
MFTGLVSDVGTILSAEGDPARLRRYVIDCAYPAESILLGASIACSGVCLTAVQVEASAPGRTRFIVEAAQETLSRTLVGSWREGQRINLERSLRVGDELGGHLVTGHVDGVAEVVAHTPVTDAAGPWGPTARFDLRPPANLMPLIATKGSVALDGVSLTVNSVTDSQFSVLLIPHTLAHTTFGSILAGSRVHIEVDVMARYAARLMEARKVT